MAVENFIKKRKRLVDNLHKTVARIYSIIVPDSTFSASGSSCNSNFFCLALLFYILYQCTYLIASSIQVSIPLSYTQNGKICIFRLASGHSGHSLFSFVYDDTTVM